MEKTQEDSIEEIIVAASGYFDPFHVGHLECLEKAKELGHKLIVIVNNDKQCKLKKGYSFMPEHERIKLVKALACVDEVFLSIDEDKTICKSLATIKPHIFAKGGDRTADEIPEGPICKEHNIKIIDGLGAKIQSSSDLVQREKEIKEQLEESTESQEEN